MDMMHTPHMQPEGAFSATTKICEVAVDPSVGNIPKLVFHWQGRTLEPLHRAPWIEQDGLPDAMPPVDRLLSGDFLCAPFAMGDVEPSPLHGWTANSAWSLINQDAGALVLQLDRKVMGATITKRVEPGMNAPLLYQTHNISGGSGGITLAHHPMTRVMGGARLFCSPKRIAITPDTAIVEGSHCFALGARAHDLRAIPASGGGTVDITQLPIASGTEDFITLVEAENSTLGWTAVIREAFDDIVFVLKDPRVLPVTMLWHSNGGREDAPWDGRHQGVLGIEDGIAAGAAGHKAALGDNPIRRTGVATALELSEETTHRIAHVIGAVPRPVGWDEVTDITVEDEVLRLYGRMGQDIRLPFKNGFFSA
jgi:hypothetical protein